MTDPLSEVISILRLRAVFMKSISGVGRWRVRYSESGQPSICAVSEGSCRLAVDGYRPLTLEGGDFVLLPAIPGFTMSGVEPVKPVRIDPRVTPSPTREVRHSTRGGPPVSAALTASRAAIASTAEWRHGIGRGARRGEAINPSGAAVPAAAR